MKIIELKLPDKMKDDYLVTNLFVNIEGKFSENKRYLVLTNA